MDNSLSESEELVSGNLAGIQTKTKKAMLKEIANISTDFDSGDNGQDFPTTSTQVDRVATKRLALTTSSEEANSGEDDQQHRTKSGLGGSKRTSRGKAKKSVEPPPRPQRKSRRLVDSSTGDSSSEDSTQMTRSKKRSKN